MDEAHRASLVIGAITIIIIALFFLLKLIVHGILTHGALVAFTRWRRARKARKWMREQDEKKERANRRIPSHRDPT